MVVCGYECTAAFGLRDTSRRGVILSTSSISCWSQATRLAGRFSAPNTIFIQAPPIMLFSTRLLRWIVCFFSAIYKDYIKSHARSRKSDRGCLGVSIGVIATT